jgi:hypothetical protein
MAGALQKRLPGPRPTSSRELEIRSQKLQNESYQVLADSFYCKQIQKTPHSHSKREKHLA